MTNPQRSASSFIISLSILLSDIQAGRWEAVSLRCYHLGQWSDLEPLECETARGLLNELIRSLNQQPADSQSSSKEE